MYASMDSFFEAICKQNEKRNSTLFPFEEEKGAPPVIRVPGGTVQEQLDLVAELYLDKDGCMDTVEVAPLTKNVIDSVVNPKGKGFPR